MEQEQILSTLNERLGQTSLSERTISEYIGANLPQEGQEFDFDRHVTILKSLDGNFSADMKKAVEDFKKNYKPAEPPKPKDKKDDVKLPDNDGEGVIAKLLMRIEGLENSLKESGRQNKENSMRERISGLKDSLKVQNKNLWNDCVASLKIEESDTEETLTTNVKALYEKKLKEYFGNGAIPYGGKSSEKSETEKKAANDARDRFKSRMKSQGRL